MLSTRLIENICKKLQVSEFDKFSKETAAFCINKFSWYYMPVSVHKILLHGSAVVECLILPIGMMSEKAQKARNKVYRRVRERHIRKMSREKTTTDLMSVMLQQSDPVTSKKNWPKYISYKQSCIISLISTDS